MRLALKPSYSDCTVQTSLCTAARWLTTGRIAGRPGVPDLLAHLPCDRTVQHLILIDHSSCCWSWGSPGVAVPYSCLQTSLRMYNKTQQCSMCFDWPQHLNLIDCRAYCWSWGPLGWLYPTEIQTLETRSCGLAVASFCNLLFSAVIAQTFLTILCSLQVSPSVTCSSVQSLHKPSSLCSAAYR